MTENKSIYALIPIITGELGGINKDKNSGQGYNYRTVEDVYDKLNPLLVKHGVSIIPFVEESKTIQLAGTNNRILHKTVLDVRYDIWASDGSHLTAKVTGEALDYSDKATPKALSMAYKYMAFQVFCIMVGEALDSEKDNFEAQQKPKDAAPPVSLFDSLSAKIKEAKDEKQLSAVASLIAKATLSEAELTKLREEYSKRDAAIKKPAKK